MSWRLRAELALAKLHRRGDEREEALRALAATRALFSEGFDSPDVQEASALIEIG